jgi:hypothetical protein
MSSQETLQTPLTDEFIHLPNGAFLNSVENAKKIGFSLEESLKKDHPKLNEEELQNRVERVFSTASGIAEAIGVDDDFFEDASNVILFNAVADSWISLEDSSNEHNEHSRNSRERSMLQDVALMIAGQKCEFVRSLHDAGVSGSEVFVDIETNITPEKKNLNEFFDSLVNQELSREVAEVLSDFSEGSFLDNQRKMLGVAEGNEKSFTVRVLNFGSDEYELKQVGALPEEPEFPKFSSEQTEEEKLIERRKGEVWDAWKQEAHRITEPVSNATTEYNERFKEKFGPMPPAWVEKKSDGSTELVLMAHQALAVINSTTGKDMPILSDADSLERLLAYTRHEYAHTQKDLTRGEHTQLGLILEERKAELVSGDKQGYVDVKLFLRDMEMVTDHKILNTLEESLQEDDSLAHFLARSTHDIGLRDTLMFMIAKPIPYESNPDSQKYFPDFGCFRTSKDVSGLDAIIRMSAESMPEEVMKARVAERVAKIVLADFDVEFMKNEWMAYRERNGVSHINGQFIDELEKRIEQET